MRNSYSVKAVLLAAAWLLGQVSFAYTEEAANAPSGDAGKEVVVAHFGDSNTDTPGPEEKRVNGVLEKYLKKCYPEQAFKCVNLGQGGDYIQKFMEEGGAEWCRYQKMHRRYPKIDFACIRYGQNDMKMYSTDEFEMWLKKLIDKLNQDYPGIHVILETGIYIDGKHWEDQTKDVGTEVANRKYQEFWDVTRKVAKSLNLPLVDQWQRWDVETKSGVWDLRLPSPDHADDVKHPQHYYNAHANYTGVELYALELLRRLRHDYPAALPKAGEKGVDPAANPVPEPQAWSDADLNALRALGENKSSKEENAAAVKKIDALLGLSDAKDAKAQPKKK